MPCSNKELLLFTAEFPFGIKSETFLETELDILSNGFRSITIFPSKSHEISRTYPENVKVNTCLVDPIFKKDKTKILLSNIFLVIKILSSETRDKGLKVLITNLKVYLDHLSQELIKAKRLKQTLGLDKKNIVLYDYWFQNSTVALSILKHQKKIHSFVSRGHGYDIYDERFPLTGVRFRRWIMEKITTVFIVSDYGTKYMRSKVKKKYKSKVQTAKLGVRKASQLIDHKTNEITIVSCARMERFKRIELIPQILREMSKNIRWVHFGDGPTMDFVKENCRQLPENIQFELKGQVKNIEILNFYNQNKVDLFVSLSQSEGLPVSMMEAMSYGIPIMSVSVGGISEIVHHKKSGLLIDRDAELAEITAILSEALTFEFNRESIIDFFDKNYNADINYFKFMKSICT